MFKEALDWSHIIAPKLQEFNSAINWHEVIVRASEMDDVDALEKLFKPRLWTAKNIENEQKNYFLYYTELLKPIQQFSSIAILAGTPDELCDELRQCDANKESVLRRLLTLWHIPIDPNAKVVVPVWHSTEEWQCKDCIIVDDNDCYTIKLSNDVVNRVLLSVKLISLGIDSEMALTEVKKFKFL